LTRGRRDERGAVAVFLAVTVSLLVIVGAFAVDLGMQRVVRRDMQALADVVALDLARELDGRTTAQLAPQVVASSSSSALARSLAGNRTTLGDNRAVVATWGFLNGGAFTPSTSGQVPTAVKVSAGADIGFSFTSGRGAATRTAYAQSSTTACHELGSVAVAVKSGDAALLAPLNSLLGLDLDLLSYQSIAAVKVTLAQLVATSRVGTETQLLTGLVDFGDLVQATIDVLDKQKPAGYLDAVSSLGAFMAIEGTVPALQLGNLLSIAPSDGAALETGLNVLDLLTGALLVADGKHALTVDKLQAKIPGLGGLAGTIYVQEGKRLACGAPNTDVASAKTAQLSTTMALDLAANGGVNSPSLGINLGAVKGTLQTQTAIGSLQVELGEATSRLVDPPAVHCGEGTAASPHTFSVDVQSGLATYRLGTDVRITGKLQVGVPPLKVDVDVDMVVGMAVSSAPPGATGTVALSLPPNDTVPVQTGSAPQLLTTVVPTVKSGGILGGAGLNGLLSGVGFTNLSLSQVIATELVNDPNGLVQKSLVPLAAKIDASVIGPLARLLGIRVGGADVFAVNAVCGVPALRG
jgi:uncharacterized membrane protein